MTTDTQTREEKIMAYAERNEYVYMSTGMPETSVYLDGMHTPIQCIGREFRLAALCWARAEGWDEIDTIVDDDGQEGTVTWEDGTPISIEWRDLSDDEIEDE